MIARLVVLAFGVTQSEGPCRRLVGGEIRCGCFVAVLAEPAGDRVERCVSGDHVDQKCSPASDVAWRCWPLIARNTFVTSHASRSLPSTKLW